MGGSYASSSEANPYILVSASGKELKYFTCNYLFFFILFHFISFCFILFHHFIPFQYEKK